MVLVAQPKMISSYMRQKKLIKAVAVVPKGLETEGAAELEDLGALAVQPLRKAVAFRVDMAGLYRLYLQARLPFRLLREVIRFPCYGPETLYYGIQQALNWELWLPPNLSFRVDVSGHTSTLNHSHFTALQVKNALVDTQRQRWGKRSSIDCKTPDLCLHLHLGREKAVLSLDGSPGSLHRRGYRPAVGIAPLKENLAAGLIRLTGWNGQIPLVDPCCGSATLLIEAALIASCRAPGLGRAFCLKHWVDFDPVLWQQEWNRAQSHKLQRPLPQLMGWEINPLVAEQARTNVSVAGLSRDIIIHTDDLSRLQLPRTAGVIVCNPPYGIRIGHETNLRSLYSSLGAVLREQGSGWDFWLLSGNPSLTAALKLKACRRIPIDNGGLNCRWMHYVIR